jgi:hypothetical protein
MKRMKVTIALLLGFLVVACAQDPEQWLPGRTKIDTAQFRNQSSVPNLPIQGDMVNISGWAMWFDGVNWDTLNAVTGGGSGDLMSTDTTDMLIPYIQRGDTAAMLLPYALDTDLSSYLELADTTAMLLPYIINGDTIAMLAPYISRGDTAAMLVPYLEWGDLNLVAGDTSTMLIPYIERGDTASMLVPYATDDTTAAIRSTANQNVADIDVLEGGVITGLANQEAIDLLFYNHNTGQITYNDTTGWQGGTGGGGGGIIAGDTGTMLIPYIERGDTAAMLLPYVLDTDLASWSGTTNITTLGTIGTGVWNGTAIADGYVANDITLTNITQITTRPITSLTASNWRLFYSNGSGTITELALGTSGQFLQSNGASSAPTFEVPPGNTSDSIVGLFTFRDSVRTVLADTIAYGSDTTTQWAVPLSDSSQFIVGDKIALWYYNGPDTIYVHESRVVCPTGSPDFTYNVHWASDITGTDTDMYSANRQVTGTDATSTGEVDTPDTAIIPPGNWIWLRIYDVTVKPPKGASFNFLGYTY